MPIAIQCGSCKSRFNAPEQMAGKAVKCSKCGQGIPVPGGNVTPSRPPAPPPAGVKAPASRSQPAPAPVRLPLRSFDELKVPSRLRKTIDKTLNGEPMLWLGRPTPQSLLSKAVLGMWVGIVMSVLAGAGISACLLLVQDTTMLLVLSGMAGLILLTMGLPMATMPIWVKWLINYRDCYVITPTRAIVFDNEKVLWANPRPYTAGELKQRGLQVNADGTGSIVFEFEVVDLGTRTTIRKKVKDTGQYREIKYIKKTRQETGVKAVGFMDIENAKDVETMLRQVLKLGPPATQEIE